MGTVRALLLKTGEYPDLGVSIGVDTLDTLVRNFLPVPVLLEHVETPFRLGEVVRIWREGDTLYGELSLYDEAQALLERWGLKSLSVGLTGGLTRLLEVSVTARPRVREARLLNSVRDWSVWAVGFAEGWRANAEPFRFPLEMERAWDADGTERAWREWVSDKEPSAWGEAEWSRYRRRYLAWDASDPQKFGSYKLPVVGVVDGEPRLFWRALVAAKAALRGARGGVDLPARVKGQLLEWIDEVLEGGRASSSGGDGGEVGAEFGFVYAGGEVLAMREDLEMQGQRVLEGTESAPVQGAESGALKGTKSVPVQGAESGALKGTKSVPVQGAESGVSDAELESLRAEVARLRFAQREARARERARAWREQGLITPAQESLVVSLLCAESDAVRFSVGGEELSLEGWLERFIALGPRFPVGESLGEVSSGAGRYASRLGLSAEGAQLAQLFAEGREAEAYARFREMVGGGG